ncbi:MAG: glycosyl hydrolase family 30 [Dysgonamonadaceae bacterium]|jgi:glucosylceramidase|nr:glycosyl hydrolase family 30 [Dysgonamonadaceae bacterium]
MKQLLLFCIAGLFVFTACDEQVAGWVSTTDENRWQRQANIILTNKPETENYVEILTNQPQQVIDGFGACFNELGWDALQLVDEATRDQILNDLFNPDEGLKFNFCRTPVGANDYSRDWYSYDEVDGDFELKHFSIERDREALIPYIRSALKINPDIRLWASPWSAPTWMKTNRHYANKSTDCNDLPKEKEAPLYTDQFIQEPEYLQAFALYFSKYLDAYKSEGIDISMIMYQNEAFTFSQWPNGSWKPQSIANFNGKYLGPQLAKTHPEVEIYAGTFNTSDPDVFETILNDPDVKKYIKGVALQWEGRDIIATIQDNYPELRLMQSESECGNGAFGWKDAEHTFNLMKHYFNGGANSYMSWNMLLRDSGSSSWCWTQNALIRILSDTKEVIYTPEYYVYKHVSSFVPQGSVKLAVKTNEDYDNLLAFQTPDANIIVVLANYRAEPEKVTLKIDQKYLSVALPARSFNTISMINLSR